MLMLYLYKGLPPGGSKEHHQVHFGCLWTKSSLVWNVSQATWMADNKTDSHLHVIAEWSGRDPY